MRMKQKKEMKAMCAAFGSIERARILELINEKTKSLNDILKGMVFGKEA